METVQISHDIIWTDDKAATRVGHIGVPEDGGHLMVTDTRGNPIIAKQFENMTELQEFAEAQRHRLFGNPNLSTIC